MFPGGNDWKNWAKDNPYDALCYFSPPYSKEARELGYDYT